MKDAIKLQEDVTTSVLHATEELSPVVAVHAGVTTAVPEVVTVAQTTAVHESVTTAVPEVVTVAQTKAHVRESQELGNLFAFTYA